MNMIENFEKMLASGQDNALLRYSLGNAYLQQGQLQSALLHLEMSLQHDPAYSAAWKAYGKALVAAERNTDAIAAYIRGIEVAEEKGDKQAAKEMQVFLKRLQKACK